MPLSDAGVKIQARSPLDGSIKNFVSLGTSKVDSGTGLADRHLYNFWVSFHRQGFELRFVAADGIPGPWGFCARNTPIGIDLDGSGAVDASTGTSSLTSRGTVLWNFYMSGSLLPREFSST